MNIKKWGDLPPFMIADPGVQEDEAHCGYVLHTHFPRFLLSIDDTTGERDIFPIADTPEPVTTLLDEAADFYKSEMGL
jgi:hypothetical protein